MCTCCLVQVINLSDPASGGTGQMLTVAFGDADDDDGDDNDDFDNYDVMIGLMIIIVMKNYLKDVQRARPCQRDR